MQELAGACGSLQHRAGACGRARMCAGGCESAWERARAHGSVLMRELTEAYRSAREHMGASNRIEFTVISGHGQGPLLFLRKAGARPTQSAVHQKNLRLILAFLLCSCGRQGRDRPERSAPSVSLPHRGPFTKANRIEFTVISRHGQGPLLLFSA